MRQVIVLSPVRRTLARLPRSYVLPEVVFKLVLDIEQPDADRSSEKCHRKMHKQERANADQPNHQRGESSDRDIRRHRTQPGLPTTAHQSQRKTLPQDKVVRGTNTKLVPRTTLSCGNVFRWD